MSGAPPSSPNICYYSPRSPYSVAFLEELARSPYSREFRFVCVDANDAGIRPVLPPYVKAVPTLMIAGEAEPRVDSQVMNWLSERRLSERRTVPVSTPGGMRAAASGGGSAASAAAAADVGPMAFGGSDMMFGGGDEGFAYLDDNTNPSSENMVRMAGNMASLNDLHMLSAPDSRTMPGAMLVAGGSSSGGSASGSSSGGSGSGAATTAKAKALQSAFESFRSSRDKDIPGPVARR